MLIFSVVTFSQTDWSKSLKSCWGINEKVFHIASDNVSKNIFLFSADSVKSINPINGQILWENKENFDNYSDFFILSNNVMYSAYSNQKKKRFLFSVNIFSGLSNWFLEIPNGSQVFLSSNENKILLYEENLEKYYINLQTGQKIFSDNLSLQTSQFILELGAVYLDFQGKTLKFGYLGKSDNNSAMTKKFDDRIILLNTNTLLWSTDDNYFGVYNLLSRKNQWKRKIGGKITDMKTFRNTIYISSLDNFIYLFSITDGRFLMKQRFDARITNSSEIHEDRIAVSAYNSNSIKIINLRDVKVENILTLSDANLFSVHHSFVDDKLIVATPSKVIAYSPNCK